MKRNSTYIAFVLAGALLGERVSSRGWQMWLVMCTESHLLYASLQVVNYGFDAAWERNNQGVSSNTCSCASC